MDGEGFFGAEPTREICQLEGAAQLNDHIEVGGLGLGGSPGASADDDLLAVACFAPQRERHWQAYRPVQELRNERLTLTSITAVGRVVMAERES